LKRHTTGISEPKVIMDDLSAAARTIAVVSISIQAIDYELRQYEADLEKLKKVFLVAHLYYSL